MFRGIYTKIGSIFLFQEEDSLKWLKFVNVVCKKVSKKKSWGGSKNGERKVWISRS
jgi:hypothetical protein